MAAGDAAARDDGLEFWFDFSSPYAFFAAREVEAMAARVGRRARWRPFLLGALFPKTRMAPLTQQPLRGTYGLRDWARQARRHGVRFAIPDFFPVAAQAPSRMFLHLEQADPERAVPFARAQFAALFSDGIDISRPEAAAAVGARLGLDETALLDAAGDPALKQRLRDQTAEAEARGVFGAPFFFADGEPFWGADRLAMVEDWLRSGGW